MSYEPVEILVKKGDKIKSKHGILFKSPLSGKTYLVYEAKYMGNGAWQAIRKKQVKEVNNNEGTTPGLSKES